jgi:hypothetical protein
MAVAPLCRLAHRVAVPVCSGARFERDQRAERPVAFPRSEETVGADGAREVTGITLSRWCGTGAGYHQMPGFFI